MNTAHFHLLLNHFPVIGSILGVLVLSTGFLFKQTSVKRVALFVFILSAFVAIPAFLTGEGAEDVVENLAGLGKSFVEVHEDWASVYVWFAGGLGVLSCITLLFDFKGWRSSSFLYAAVMILALTTIGLSARVGTTGGEIRHTEIRNDATAQNTINSGEQDED